MLLGRFVAVLVLVVALLAQRALLGPGEAPARAAAPSLSGHVRISNPLSRGVIASCGRVGCAFVAQEAGGGEELLVSPDGLSYSALLLPVQVEGLGPVSCGNSACAVYARGPMGYGYLFSFVPGAGVSAPYQLPPDVSVSALSCGPSVCLAGGQSAGGQGAIFYSLNGAAFAPSSIGPVPPVQGVACSAAACFAVAGSGSLLELLSSSDNGASFFYLASAGPGAFAGLQCEQYGCLLAAQAPTGLLAWSVSGQGALSAIQVAPSFRGWGISCSVASTECVVYGQDEVSALAALYVVSGGVVGPEAVEPGLGPGYFFYQASCASSLCLAAAARADLSGPALVASNDLGASWSPPLSPGGMPYQLSCGVQLLCEALVSSSPLPFWLRPDGSSGWAAAHGSTDGIQPLFLACEPAGVCLIAGPTPEGSSLVLGTNQVQSTLTRLGELVGGVVGLACSDLACVVVHGLPGGFRIATFAGGVLADAPLLLGSPAALACGALRCVVFDSTPSGVVPYYSLDGGLDWSGGTILPPALVPEASACWAGGCVLFAGDAGDGHLLALSSSDLASWAPVAGMPVLPYATVAAAACTGVGECLGVGAQETARNPSALVVEVGNGVSYAYEPGLSRLYSIACAYSYCLLAATSQASRDEVLAGQLPALASLTELPMPDPSLLPEAASCARGGCFVLAGGQAWSEVESTSPSLPVVTGVSPESGGVAGGEVVRIAGQGLSGTNSVWLGGIAATILEATTDEVEVVAPPHSPGLYDVVVQSQAGTAGLSGAFLYVPSGYLNLGPLTPLCDTRVLPTNSTPCRGVDLGRQGDFVVRAAGYVPWVPAAATALVLDVQVFPRAGQGFLQAFPPGMPPPDGAIVAFAGGLPSSQLALVPTGAGASIALRLSGEADVAIGVEAYVAPSGLGFQPVGPARVADSRVYPGNSFQLAGELLSPGQAVTVSLASLMPPGSAGALVAITVVPAGPGAGEVTYQGSLGESLLPLVAYEGAPATTKAFLTAGPNGTITLLNSGSYCYLIVDVYGVLSAGAPLATQPSVATRLIDTRGYLGNDFPGGGLLDAYPGYTLALWPSGMPFPAGATVVAQACAIAAALPRGFAGISGAGTPPATSDLQLYSPVSCGTLAAAASAPGYLSVVGSPAYLVLDMEGYFG